MSEDAHPTSSRRTPPAATRADRLASELRANLARRKARARAQKSGERVPGLESAAPDAATDGAEEAGLSAETATDRDAPTS